MFHGYVAGAPRAVLKGGRYDYLMQRFTPGANAIGFALYIDELERPAAQDAGAERSWLNIALPKGRLGDKAYALLAAVLALPQLWKFTFAQADNAGFLHLSFNWVNQEDPYLWFYIKNIGVVFLLLPFALLSEKRLRGFWLCALPLWVVCEFIVFQPNNYDNNKLLFVVHMISCGLVASFLGTMYHKLRGMRGRALMGAAVVFAGTVSGALTLAREVVSDYELFSDGMVEAAQYARENLPDDAVLLTADEHNNPFASLAGQTIVQGSPTFLYFHGVYDTDRAADVRAMYTQEGALESLAGKYGVTHVVLSWHELSMGADPSLFADLPVVYANDEVTIYSLK